MTTAFFLIALLSFLLQALSVLLQLRERRESHKRSAPTRYGSPKKTKRRK